MLKKNTSPETSPMTATGSLLKNPQNSTEIQKILLLLREFQKMDPEFPLQYAICLLQIARGEGLSLTELAQRSSMALSTVSRIVGALSQFRQIGQPYELVRVEICAGERRKKELYLTDKGRALVDEIIRISQIQ